MSISDTGRASAGTLAAVTLVVIAAALAVPAWRHWRESPPGAPPPLRLSLAAPADIAIGGGSDYPFGLAAAPDGRRIAFPAARSGLHQLWLHDLTTGATSALPGTDGGVLPFWSSDGRQLAFFSGGHLHALDVRDGSVRTLADAPAPRGGVWHPDGDIIFAPAADSALLRWRAVDNKVEPLTSLDTSGSELSHRHPALVHDGRQVLFFVRASESARQGVWVAPLSAPAERRKLLSGETSAIAMGDLVVYSSDDALVAQPLNPDDLSLSGRPQVLGASVGRDTSHRLLATVSEDLLISAPPMSTLRQLRWADRGGALHGTVGEPMEAWEVRIAPIGSSVAVTRLDPQLGTLDIWTYEGDRPLPRRISSAIDVDESPVWAPSATEIGWVSGRRALTRRGAMAEIVEDTIRRFERPIRVSDWTAGGPPVAGGATQWMIVSETHPASRDDLWMVPASGGAEPRPLVQSPFNELQGVLSPDGELLAYASDESGRFEIYVDSFPTPGKRARITSGGGSDPRWDRNGRLYFRRGNEIHTAAVALDAAMPEALSSERLFDAGQDLRSYDVSPDGQRFLLNLPQPDATSRPIGVIVNWRAAMAGR
jgi:hypothetical protein